MKKYSSCELNTRIYTVNFRIIKLIQSAVKSLDLNYFTVSLSNGSRN